MKPTDEQRLADFEKAWQSDSGPSLDEFAIGVTSETLRELVVLDLEYRWRRYHETASDWLWPERPPSLEAYVSRFPALELDNELIGEEYRARHAWGDHPNAEEYLERFQNRLELPALLAEIDAELLREAVPTIAATERIAQATIPVPSSLDRVGDYVVIGTIAAGATGIVYAANHSVTGEAVAIKVVHPHLLTDTEARNRFDREVRLLIGIDHPNLVRVLAVERVGGRFAAIMERVTGTDLYGQIRVNGPLSASEAVSVLSQVATGLAALHERGIAHRDLSPSNIMLSPDGRVKLIDLGLSKRFPTHSTIATGSPSSWVTPEGNALFGTPDYVAPETIRDCTSASSPADVYGLGGVAYFVLTGSPPFPHGTPLEKLFHHLAATPPSLVPLRPDLPRKFVQTIEQCLAKLVDHRPTAADLATTFNQLQTISYSKK